jgi:hypothetical protein
MALTEDAMVSLSFDKQTHAAALGVNQSVRRPGTFFMFRAFTRQGLTPYCSRTSYSGIQYTPVDSIATVVTPQLTSHRAISSRSSVNVGKTRTGFSSRSAGTATKISRAPMSIPPAFGCS